MLVTFEALTRVAMGGGEGVFIPTSDEVSTLPLFCPLHDTEGAAGVADPGRLLACPPKERPLLQAANANRAEEMAGEQQVGVR